MNKVNEMICNIPKVNTKNIVEVVTKLSEALKETNTIGFFITVKEQMEKYNANT